MATTTKTKPRLDTLSDSELVKFTAVDTVLVPGHPYLFIMTFGWAKVGYYIKHTAPNRILVAHCSHFANAGKDYGRLMTEGVGANCEWRYEGEMVELATAHIIEQGLYHGKIHRGRIIGDN